ncbi:hypothetical protein Tsubulata_030745, partial [Turnera subulata]
ANPSSLVNNLHAHWLQIALPNPKTLNVVRLLLFKQKGDMDTSSPAIFVNGELLGSYVGKKVRTVVQVGQSDGGDTIGKSTDERQVIIKGVPPLAPMSYVEVIGIAESTQSILAEKWTDFGTKFDAFSYNQLCQLANGEFKALFL